MQTDSTYLITLPANIDPDVSQIIRNFARDTKYLLKDNVIAEYLFGSYATNTETSLSDIDILIIVKHATPQIQWQMGGLASEYSLKYNVCMSPILQDIEVWNKNQQYRTLFYQEVTEHGIPL
jgi:hypothetical protein